MHGCIIIVPNFLPPIIRENINKFNAPHGDEPTEPPREWNIQPPEVPLKSRTLTPKASPVISDIMGRINHRAIDNGGVDVYTPYYTLKYTSVSVPDPYKISSK